MGEAEKPSPTRATTVPAPKEGDRNGQRIRKEKKVTILREQFFPPPPEADLGDIATASYPPELYLNQEIKEDEIASIISYINASKASGSNVAV
ncbi:hypothetical protein MMC14_005746 [Varicellaria rhodocarpa]|nr:hypothetical protein [Varicellaria rhodocarpa]